MKDDGPHPLIPHMRLDELLSELQGRLEAVLATRDRVHALLEAVVSIGSDLDLETVLRRIVETATGLVDARYGAMGVIGEDNTLVQVVPVGLTDEEVSRIEHWPHGLGLLGLLIKEPRTLRLADISHHPESYGFPPGHPLMRRFLGVPIRVRDEVFGNLYLTDKRGGAEFDEDDEAIVVALATAAGVAIENARLYEDTRRREAWLQASSEVTTSLLSGAEPHEVLALMARRAREMGDADVVWILLPSRDGQTLVVRIAEHAAGADQTCDNDACADDTAQFCLGHACHGDEVPIAGSLAGRAFLSGEPLLADDLVERDPAARDDPSGADQINAEHLTTGPLAAVPIGTAGAVRGVLYLGKRPGRMPFSRAELRMFHGFAGQAAVALELAETRKHAERLGLLEDRDRIAKDLHDVVIQRLFAVAMTLMSAARLVDAPEASSRLQSAIDELDGTIRQIRSTIFALQTPRETAADGLRTQLVDLVESTRGHLGFMPGLSMEGQLDSAVPPAIAEHLLAVLREALSNVVRHAKASRADVIVRNQDRWLTLVVTDNGVGVPPDGRRSGLRNMAERADKLGGSCTVTTPVTGGTRLEWRVPLD